MAKARAMVGLLAGLALASCMTNAAEQVSLRDAWGDCVAAAVAQMDDGKTDPVSLAYGIAPQCAVQYQQFSQGQIDGNITEGGRLAARQLWRDKEVQMITSAILIHRSKGRRS